MLSCETPYEAEAFACGKKEERVFARLFLETLRFDFAILRSGCDSSAMLMQLPRPRTPVSACAAAAVGAVSKVSNVSKVNEVNEVNVLNVFIFIFYCLKGPLLL